MQLRFLAAVVLGVGLLAGCAKNEEAADAKIASRCKGLTGEVLGAAKAKARWVAADQAKGLSGFCEVTATLSPEKDSEIGVVYRLPAGWNGKMLGLGGGGWAGNVTLEVAMPGLAAHYATAQTDGGHPGTDLWDNEWAAQPGPATDFSWRAVREMTVAGKKLVAAFYGKPHTRAYFQGCSTGGRQALMEAQRFPDDYDGIVSGAPVYSLQVQSSAVMRNNLFAQPGAGLDDEEVKLVNRSVLSACDALDGIKDGVIADPRSCSWTPEKLACKPGQETGCLTLAQVNALAIAYEGVRTPDGSWAQLPLSKGGEAGWGVFIAVAGGGREGSNGGGMAGLSRPLFGVDAFDYSKLTPRDVMRARSSPFAKMYEATDPDLADYFARGGKLLLWHGESDPGPSPVATIDYAEQVMRADPEGGAGGFRLFLAPGVEHCQGGPGADRIDTLAALDAWLESDTAPDMVTGTRVDGSMTRPICAWPKVAHYKGKGDANDPANYACEARN